MSQQANNLKIAERGALIGIAAYILLSIAKLTAGNLFHSSALTADGFNNMSDILANLAVLIGLRLARRPADTDHKFGHWKIEDLASLITSFLMFAVGFDILWDTVQKIVHQETSPVDPIGAVVGIFSAIVMFGVYYYNSRLADRVHSKALKAAAKDNLTDALISTGTAIAILASSFNFPIVDKIAAIAITILILKTAYGIFMESYFTLSDGFDEQLLEKYSEDILKLPKISAVKAIRGRTYGSNIYLDVVLEMHPDLSVYESHDVTEQVENLLKIKYQVFDVDIHVEPALVDDDEVFENIFNKLYRMENLVLTRQDHYQDLVADSFKGINAQGEHLTKEKFLTRLAASEHMTHFSVTPISQKSMLVQYHLGQNHHTSLWRRHETWQLLFHQVTKISH
ncbi:cation diffusion facilitator family transporter [Streptococcus moroccensis]|uniref:Cation diffusion facilitator family transporter n=1 Tax=Streptococcus moroccensis TaxID=1451356 RepID=A0ABT9YT57_9STRE|nr:cation diffusion facilitator family transporter [Streptococcus moroccensis]MDQ0223153.1 cation diffusion facilitator family transporter [Streptococcus moroccensis]